MTAYADDGPIGMFQETDFVVLLRDLPDAGLRAGDFGAIVHTYHSDAVEVEFVTASGRTQAVLTLKTDQIRTDGEDDWLNIRSMPDDRQPRDGDQMQ